MVGAVAGVVAAAAAGAGTRMAEAEEAGDFMKAPSGLGFKDTSEGTGASPEKGQLIKVRHLWTELLHLWGWQGQAIYNLFLAAQANEGH